MPRTEVPLTAMGELAGSVARAIGGPLTAINMAVERLQGRNPDVRDAEELRLIQDQVQRMGGLAQALRTLALPDRGEAGELDVNDLVHRVARATRAQLAPSGIRLEVEPAPGLPRARGDARQVQEVLLSLLYNARMALEGWKGVREIRLQTGVSPTGRIEIRVKDSGPGVPAGEEERIFLPFVSGWGRDGMGLSYSRLALMGQEGQVDVEPSDGTGACFTVRLAPWGLSPGSDPGQELEQ
jgi:two-component system, NtrC family, sensor histidine kinase HydH